ncbi:hypothetical protein A5N82_09965 [Christensenella minuta]|uniref:Uncharacterized protein n=1 Tax=Christensenella minuta TaxID=626937 RepID=A0A136Q1H3_9FIRM|nr:hypothetical protein B1H56_08410 [Christensenella minuta]KXK64346.1 hypothetical protein HMPREF3293_03001 [Christensenella minuta]OAQ41486.1 hypothetical protein A5N82_09965 [Christensenella minuta]
MRGAAYIRRPQGPGAAGPAGNKTAEIPDAPAKRNAAGPAKLQSPGGSIPAGGAGKKERIATKRGNEYV